MNKLPFKEVTLKTNLYRVELIPNPYAPAKVLYNAFRLDRGNWSELRMFTGAQERAFPKTIARLGTQMVHEYEQSLKQ